MKLAIAATVLALVLAGANVVVGQINISEMFENGMASGMTVAFLTFFWLVWKRLAQAEKHNRRVVRILLRAALASSEEERQKILAKVAEHENLDEDEDE